MAISSLGANGLWLGSMLPEAARFWASAGRLATTQAALLRGYLDANRETEYGRRHSFASIRTPREFQRAVPLSTYDDYATAIDRLGRREGNLLTSEPVRLFEPSSGSTAASKLIPYTARLKAEFGRGIAPWIVDLYRHRPALMGGRAYWSITPLAGGPRSTPAGIPIGFEEDSAYLGTLGRGLVESVLTVPGAVKGLGDVETFRYASLLFLLRDRSLRLISVWNPTYLELLLAPLGRWWGRLIADVSRGGIDPPAEISPGLLEVLARTLPPDPARARELARLSPSGYLGIWPDLGLLSCWADGPSRGYAEQLAALFPGVHLQPKGLLATEAFVTLPILSAPAPVLAARSHFFEFVPDGEGEPVLAHEVEVGRSYSVVVTTGGGFYRYQLRDRAEVVGFYRGLPCLRFLGKTDQLSDYFGEKLEDGFVAGVVAEVLASRGCTSSFTLLAPDEDATGFRYVLYLETETADVPAASLAEELDRGLRRNFHYDYCRRLGQLAPAEVVLLRSGASELYLDACRERGQRLGNIKPLTLQKTTGWRQRFESLRY